MALAEQKLNTFRQMKIIDSNPLFIQPKHFPINLSEHSKVITSEVYY